MTRTLLHLVFCVFLLISEDVFAQNEFLYGQKYNDYIDLAIQKMDNRQYDQAILDYQAAVKIDPNRPNAYGGLAYAYQLKGNRIQSLYYYGLCIKADNKFVTGYVFRGAFLADTLNNYDDALKDFKIATRLEPRNEFYLIALAGILFKKQDYQKAAEVYTEALKINSLSVNALAGRGWSQGMKGKTKLGEADFKTALGLDPKSITSLLGLAAIYLDGNDPYNSLKLLESVSQLDSKNLPALYQKSIAYTMLDQNDKAIESLEATLQLDPDMFNAWYALGNLYLIKGEYDKSVEAFKTCIKLEPNASEAYVQIFSPLIRQRRFKEASNIYRGYKQRNFKLVIDNVVLTFYEYYLKAATEDILTGNVEMALKKISTAVDLYHSQVKDKSSFTFAEGYAFKGYLLEKLNLKKEAIESYRTALDVVMRQPDVETALAELEGRNTNLFVSTDNERRDVPILPVEEKQARFFAILIGQNDYSDSKFDTLANPRKDRDELKRILTTSYDFANENVIMLSETDKITIVETIRKTCESMTSDDNLLIFYAGHGAVETNGLGQKDIYWVPAKAIFGRPSSYVGLDEVYKNLKYGQARHILIIADACYSGELERGIDNDAPLYVKNAYGPRSRTKLASGRANVSDESLFMNIFCRRLRENRKKYLTMHELWESFGPVVRGTSDRRFTPSYKVIKDTVDEEGDFVLIRK